MDQVFTEMFDLTRPPGVRVLLHGFYCGHLTVRATDCADTRYGILVIDRLRGKRSGRNSATARPALCSRPSSH